MLGSVGYLSVPDSIIAIDKKSKYEAYFWVKGKRADITRYFVTYDFPVWRFHGETGVTGDSKEKVYKFIKKYGPCSFSKMKEHIEEIGVPEGTLKSSLSKLKNEGVIAQSKVSKEYRTIV